MDKMTEQDGGSLDIVNENLEALKSIFPEAFKEDVVDFEVLRQLLGDVIDDGEEKYGLNWHGKKKARQIALTPSTGTLRPCPKESVDWDTTQNLFIEGDNLEVLKLLQKSYAGKVKMIYIDPPYNTGNEFIYPDKFQDNLDTYLKYTGQKDDEGSKISSNTESSGRYHTNWLNMMYPRLKLAKNLLRDDGAIFISIDDNEVDNLKKICDEIFGEENFRSLISWQKKYSVSNNYKGIASIRDFLLVYAKSESFANGLLPRSEQSLSRYKNPDNDPRGPWKPVDYWNIASKEQRPNLVYPIKNPNTGEIINPEHKAWKFSLEAHERFVKENKIWWGKAGSNEVPALKLFLSEVKDGLIPHNWWPHEDSGHTDEAKKQLDDIFDGKSPFDTPKPLRLIKKILQVANVKDEDMVVDFFSGSCATAHAVMALNSEDNGNRKFIMVQLPEPCAEKSEAFNSGYKTISDIGKERIRRAAIKIKEENQDNDGDLGFKVFKLDSSNIRAWNPDRGDLEQTLLDHAEHLVKGRGEQDLLYELLLKRGVDLTVPIEEKEISGKTVYSIGYGVLFACLDTTISRDKIEGLGQGIIDWHKELEPSSDTQVVFRDSAFSDDIAKTNMTAILEQHGIAHVRSL